MIDIPIGSVFKCNEELISRYKGVAGFSLMAEKHQGNGSRKPVEGLCKICLRSAQIVVSSFNSRCNGINYYICDISDDNNNFGKAIMNETFIGSNLIEEKK